MLRRSRAREVAFQLLFQNDINPKVPREAIEQFLHERLMDNKAESLSRALFDSVLDRLGEIDRKLSRAAENWRLARMTVVDRNVLRLAAFELLYPNQATPAPVAINEAIELARRYGSKDSPAFVNGVLDKIMQLTARETASARPEEVKPTTEPNDSGK
jgi:N utilization substance protein B